MMAQAESAALFADENAEIDSALLNTAWVLHQAGTVRPELTIYTPERQVQSNSVAAHIFDLALGRGLAAGHELVITFAAQVSSIRGDRAPNATALARRLPSPTASLALDPGRVSLEVGCSLLSLRRAPTAELLRRLEGESSSFAASGRAFAGTRLAAASSVVVGSRALLRYLADGRADEIDSARAVLQAGVNDPGSYRDLDSRWVAAHLLDLADDLGTSSVWSVLPDGTPPAVGHAMTLGEPPVMTLWPPQISLATDDGQSPLDANVKRSVMSFPTSAGKTLLSQLVVVQHLATTGTPVCFVAPSHTLCREVREGLDRRLWALGCSTAEDGPLGSGFDSDASVVVMTPERFSARLRRSGAELLETFGLFVLDEAHLVADSTRGWAFESAISHLNDLTQDTAHRIVVLSAALGGNTVVRSWLGADSEPSTAAAAWRGPRRLHATYRTAADGPVSHRPKRGRERADRRVRKMVGVVDLYADGGSPIETWRTPIGEEEWFGKSGHKKPTRSLLSNPW